MPDHDFGYQLATFDLSDHCESCGIGRSQRVPFRIRGEPSWGKNQVPQLNWVFDEYFATPAAWGTGSNHLALSAALSLDTR